MYFNKYPSVYQPQKEIVKCNKIFRPWDSADNNNKVQTDIFSQNYPTRKESDNCPQDATISTTTENEESELNLEETKRSKLISDEPESLTKNSDVSLKEPKRIPAESEKLVFLPNQKFPHENVETAQPLVDYPVNLEGYPLYPDYVHVNLAHSLGLTPSDPLFLECVNQGCTLEEYSRVLSQEHQTKLLNARKQRPKKYRCPHCDVGFSNNGQLKGHIRIHTGERPFRCEENNCGKTFTRNEELTRHKRIHSGLRPFPCTHCGKRFGRKDHLKKHSRTHFQPRGLYAVPVMLPFDTWTTSNSYPFVPMFTY